MNCCLSHDGLEVPFVAYNDLEALPFILLLLHLFGFPYINQRIFELPSDSLSCFFINLWKDFKMINVCHQFQKTTSYLLLRVCQKPHSTTPFVIP